jgi:hypothetical protein
VCDVLLFPHPPSFGKQLLGQFSGRVARVSQEGDDFSLTPFFFPPPPPPSPPLPPSPGVWSWVEDGGPSVSEERPPPPPMPPPPLIYQASAMTTKAGRRPEEPLPNAAEATADVAKISQSLFS